MKEINLNKYPIIDKWFEFPVLGWGFKTIKCVEWKNGVRTEIYIDIKTSLSYRDFVLKLLAGKNASGNIRIETRTEVRRGMNEKEQNIELIKNLFIDETYVDPMDEFLEDIFESNSKILITNFNLNKNSKIIYYLLEGLDISLNLKHKTIKFEDLQKLGSDTEEILSTLKKMSKLQKEKIGQVNNIEELIENYKYYIK